MFIILSIIDFIVLFFLSRLITRALSRLIHRVTGRISLTVRIFSFVLLPGTFVHELSHYLVAHALGVRTFGFVLSPILEEGTVRLGSVSIQKTGPFRKTLVGLAPFLIGLFLLFSLLWWVSSDTGSPVWKILLVLYGVFQVSNTMFPSEADISGAPIFVILLVGALLAGLYFFDSSRVVLDSIVLLGFFEAAVFYLTWIIVIDVTSLGIIHGFLRIRR